MAKKVSRQAWSKIYLPPELADLFHMIARKKGFSHDNDWQFLYELLKAHESADVETLQHYLRFDPASYREDEAE